MITLISLISQIKHNRVGMEKKKHVGIEGEVKRWKERRRKISTQRIK
jgi:hypothetical protein